MLVDKVSTERPPCQYQQLITVKDWCESPEQVGDLRQKLDTDSTPEDHGQRNWPPKDSEDVGDLNYSESSLFVPIKPPISESKTSQPVPDRPYLPRHASIEPRVVQPRSHFARPILVDRSPRSTPEPEFDLSPGSSHPPTTEIDLSASDSDHLTSEIDLFFGRPSEYREAACQYQPLTTVLVDQVSTRRPPYQYQQHKQRSTVLSDQVSTERPPCQYQQHKQRSTVLVDQVCAERPPR